ncbi:MAG TPA: MFS transporter [Rhizomicrobium sp.]|nr:MFS transporter [Rhizomicrobium sp.]
MPNRRATLQSKLYYGFGSIAYGVKDNGFGVFLLIYYNQVLGLPAALVGLATMLALSFDAVLDPLIGYWSDNFHSRWGRRHPFMYAAAVPAAVLFAFLWNPPDGLTKEGLFFYLLCVAIVLRTFITLYEIPSSALVAELTADYDERTSFLSYRSLFGWWGGPMMGLLAYTVFMKPDATHPVGQLNPHAYHLYGYVGAVFIVLAILTSAAGTHRYISDFKPLPPPAPFNLRRIFREVAQTLWHRSFLMITVAGLLAAIATGLSYGLYVYFNTYFWLLRPLQISLFVIGHMVAAVFALAMAPALSRRYSKKPVAIASALASIMLGPLPFLLRLAGWFPANGSPALIPVLLAMQTVTTAIAIVSAILTASMVADIVEDSEVMTGRRSEGLFFSANSLIQKCVSGAGIFGSGLILATVGFPAHASPGHVSEAVLRDLVLVYVPVTSGLYLVSVACLAAYRITRDKHLDNLRRLASAQQRFEDGLSLAPQEASRPR